GLAVDDLTFSGGFAGKNLVWNTPNGTWNTTQSNWLDGANPSTFSTNDTVNFTDAAVGNVTVDAGGVNPADINVSNTTGTYTFTGGSINGTGKLTRSEEHTSEL